MTTKNKKFFQSLTYLVQHIKLFTDPLLHYDMHEEGWSATYTIIKSFTETAGHAPSVGQKLLGI